VNEAPRSGRLRWPWPADTPLERARRLLRGYRDALTELAPSTAKRLDDWALEHGEMWVIGAAVTFDDDELLTLQEVADLVGVKTKTVYQWHWRGLRYTSTVDGDRVRMGDLVEWERNRRLRRRGVNSGDTPENLPGLQGDRMA
jgi:hypothetical protein